MRSPCGKKTAASACRSCAPRSPRTTSTAGPGNSFRRWSSSSSPRGRDPNWSWRAGPAEPGRRGPAVRGRCGEGKGLRPPRRGGRPVGAGPMSTPLLEALNEIGERVAAAPHLIVYLDYDGTLTPLVDDPAAAHLAPQVRALVASLAGHPKTSLAILSGRDRSDL